MDPELVAKLLRLRLNKALTPIADMTNILGGENYVAISAVKLLLSVTSTKSLSLEDNDIPLTKALKTEIIEDMQRRYSGSKIVELLDVASFVDPRFKTQYIAAGTSERPAER